MRRTAALSLLLALCLAPLAAAPAAAEQGSAGASPIDLYPPEHPETRELIALVGDAAALVAEKGVAGACAEFRKEGSRWFEGERYVFVNDLEGTSLCHPAKPSLEGRNVLDLRDPHGRPVVRAFLAELERGDDGWVHYLWPVPGENTTFYWKTTYVRRVEGPDGKAYMVGSGRYQMPMERFFIVEQVDDAAALIERQGEAAFATLRDRASGFRFYDSYVFVMDSSGVHLVNAAFPENEGKNLLDLADENGKVIGREMLAVLADHDAGWVEYMWPRPGDVPATRKASYVRKVTLDGQMLVVGAGYYLD
jgi:signal transduction histidine kinase